MRNTPLLPPELFATVVRHTPLVSIDLVVRDVAGCVLVGRRNNRPAQGFWFVPGGRIGKNETLDAAFARLTAWELGRAFTRERARFLGVFEHLYDDNFSGDPSFGTHYVVLAHELQVAREALRLPVEQHSGYQWLSDVELRTRGDVHPNTRAYAR
jgi:colanic acid biosynthesis protein WcaH